MQLAVLDQVQKYVISKEGTGGIVPATLGVPDPVLSDLLQKLSDLELQYTQTKKDSTGKQSSSNSTSRWNKQIKTGYFRKY